MNDTMRIKKSLEKSGLLIKGVREKIEMKHKNEKTDFLLCH